MYSAWRRTFKRTEAYCHVTYTRRSKSLRTEFFKKSKTHDEDMCLYFTQNKLNWHIYIQAFERSYSFLKAAENSSFWTFFNSSFTASWISTTSANWSLSTSFSNCETENSLTEINLDSTGVKKGCNFFFWSKTGKHLQCCGRAYYRATRKKSRQQNAGGRTRWMRFMRRSITPL